MASSFLFPDSMAAIITLPPENGKSARQFSPLFRIFTVYFAYNDIKPLFFHLLFVHLDFRPLEGYNVMCNYAYSTAHPLFTVCSALRRRKFGGTIC